MLLMKRVGTVFFMLIGCIGCKRMVEVPPPPTQLTSDNVYTSDESAIAVLTGIYTNISLNAEYYGTPIDAISLACGLSADELSLAGGAANSNSALVQFYQNRLTVGSTANPGSGSGPWTDLYSKIYIVNLALQRLAGATSLTPSVRQQLTGEAKFLRAFFYFYLVNLYGAVPLILSTDYTVTSTLARSMPGDVFQQIIADLNDAQNVLSSGYVAGDAVTSTSQRVRPNKWAALALLARSYLYIQNWDSASAVSSRVISNTSMFHLEQLNGVFLKNSSEAIWQLQPVNAGWNTEDARVFVLPPTGPSVNIAFGNPVYVSSQLLASFENGDRRRLKWIDSVRVDSIMYYFPYKYKNATFNAPVTEYTMVLRLGEQYLIRAEAEANMGGNATMSAIADLNAIRERAGLQDYGGAADRPSLLAAVLHERQIELFTEWGHRWLDLKRSGIIDVIMNPVALSKGSTWNSDWELYPLPISDIIQDPNISQNPGY